MVTRITRLLVALGLAGALALGVAACGDDEEATQTAANTELCTAAAGFRSAIGELTALQPGDVTRNQLASVTASISSAWGALSSALQNAASVDSEALSSAWDGLKSAIQAVPGSGSPQEALTAVQAAAEPVQQAVQGVAPDCPGVTTPTGTGTTP